MEECASFVPTNKNTYAMKIRSLLLGLLLVTSVSAQKVDSLLQKAAQTKNLNAQSELDRLTQRVKKLKITPQNLVDVKEAATPTLNNLGIPTNAKDVVIFMDGKEVTQETYQKIDPTTIESISVVKNIQAIQKLTTKKCTVAIVITTKKKPAAK